MKLRNGRKQPYNIYVQLGDEPNDQVDVQVGFIKNRGLAVALVTAFNDHPGFVDGLRFQEWANG